MNFFRKLFSRNKKDRACIVIEQRNGVMIEITLDEINMEMNTKNGYITGTFIAGKEQKKRYDKTFSDYLLRGKEGEA